MSVKLYETDYLSVIGEYQKKEGMCVKSTKTSISEEKSITEYVHIFFNMQINGKLKTFKHYFELEKCPVTHVLTLKNWNEWYVLHSTLEDLGYKIGGSNDEIISNSSIMRDWIIACIRSDNNKNEFQY